MCKFFTAHENLTFMRDPRPTPHRAIQLPSYLALVPGLYTYSQHSAKGVTCYWRLRKRQTVRFNMVVFTSSSLLTTLLLLMTILQTASAFSDETQVACGPDGACTCWARATCDENPLNPFYSDVNVNCKTGIIGERVACPLRPPWINH